MKKKNWDQKHRRAMQQLRKGVKALAANLTMYSRSSGFGYETFLVVTPDAQYWVTREMLRETIMARGNPPEAMLERIILTHDREQKAQRARLNGVYGPSMMAMLDELAEMGRTWYRKG